MKKIILQLFLCLTVSAVKHSLKFFFTASSGKINFPEFLGLTVVDDVEIGYCDNITRRGEPKQDWIRTLMKINPHLLQLFPNQCLHNHYFLKADMDFFNQRLHQTEGSHIHQRMSGCEWDDDSGEIKGFVQYGYDGEDFLALDMQTMTWITPNAQFVLIKHLWNADKKRLEINKNIYILMCPKDLKDYVHYGRSFLQKTERPSVFLLQKTPSSMVNCHATGFYPHRADLLWRKDGEEIHEGAKKREILPNHDGTFQMSSELNVSLIKHEDWRRYECVFQLYGVQEDIITTLDKAEIQTNWGSPAEVSDGIIVGVVGVVLLVTSGVVCCRWMNRNDDPGRTNNVEKRAADGKHKETDRKGENESNEVDRHYLLQGLETEQGEESPCSPSITFGCQSTENTQSGKPVPLTEEKYTDKDYIYIPTHSAGSLTRKPEGI
ncbi:hypothetical protein OJAV_G00236380 [Oryzias javanicus]|uniref:Ig-like domain-containing protein n=1 Tax=Oryzias javanicus TaxID=123683 RepID=A0A3S2LJV7_ORYJA|nr:hypothetical protein OJAV_G00236380 [Oryzias javanicus]